MLDLISHICGYARYLLISVNKDIWSLNWQLCIQSWMCVHFRKPNLAAVWRKHPVTNKRWKVSTALHWLVLHGNENEKNRRRTRSVVMDNVMSYW